MALQLRNPYLALGLGALSLVALSGCSTPDDGKTHISFVVDNSSAMVDTASAMIEAFESEHPDVSVALETRPSGTEGDNLIKTRLSTGEMEDVFLYNAGSLLKALNPDETLTDLSEEEWMSGLDQDFIDVVSGDEGAYGAPLGTSSAGGVVYNKRVYEELGLEVPQTWGEFMANNAAIAEAGITPVVQTFGDSHTSQYFVLSDFANVAAADPDWAEEYTAHNRSFTEEPALAGFQRLQDVYDAGYLNPDFASATVDDGTRMVADGTAAHYPIASGVIATIEQNSTEFVEDIGFFAQPADDAKNTQATIWQPNAVYIPRTTEGAELDAAKKFVAFLNSPSGCDVQNETGSAAGPYAGLCELSDDEPPMLADVQAYVDGGRSSSALEYLSPIKGPNLENLTVEAGSGITTAQDAAARYDEDVKKQAQQLGLQGW